MNLTELRSSVTFKLFLDNSAQGDQPLIDRYANEAVRDILQKTRCTIRRSTLSLTEGEEDYEFPVSIMSVLYMRNLADNGNQFMTRVTIPDLEMMRMAEVTNGHARYYTVLGNDFFSVWPPPGDDESISLHYVPMPTEVSSGSDDFSTNSLGGIPKWAHKAIEFYVLREMADAQNHGPSKNGEQYNVRYVEMLAWINKMLRQQGGSILPTAQLGRPQRLMVPHDPSTDF